MGRSCPESWICSDRASQSLGFSGIWPSSLKSPQERYRFANQTYEPWLGLKPEDIVGKFVMLAFDITERKQAEEAVRGAVRLRDEFLSVASHELKTPLTPLSLKLQALAREAEAQPDSPFVQKARAHVEAGRKQLKRLSDLIGDLLDVSRITSGQLKPGKPIQVRLEASPGRLTLTVQDQGIGIEPEHQARIFERFERAVSERNYGGLGLGLYITHTIVEAMGGTIRVQSQPGHGACFTVELPREPSIP